MSDTSYRTEQIVSCMIERLIFAKVQSHTQAMAKVNWNISHNKSKWNARNWSRPHWIFLPLFDTFLRPYINILIDLIYKELKYYRAAMCCKPNPAGEPEKRIPQHSAGCRVLAVGCKPFCFRQLAVDFCLCAGRYCCCCFCYCLLAVGQMHKPAA